MNRRSFLTTTGVGALAGLTGCLGGSDDGSPSGPGTEPTGPATDEPTATDQPTESSGAPFEHPGTLDQTFATNGDYPEDDNPADGYPPAFEDPPEAPDADPSSFETTEENGETVRLAPVDVVIDWYYRGDARFVDARGLRQYQTAHIYGAVFSRAQGDSTGGGIDDWSTDDRVITYCGCPHHLSSLRAAGLQKAGFTDVYAIDEGFVGREDSWEANEYPMAGMGFVEGAQASISEWQIAGSVEPRFAGEYVWAAADRQYEAAPVAGDGRYDLHVRLVDADAETPIELRLPDGETRTAPLGELATQVDGRA